MSLILGALAEVSSETVFSASSELRTELLRLDNRAGV
jgi:hypothetical protein